MSHQLKRMVSIVCCFLVGLAGISSLVGWITPASAASPTVEVAIGPDYTQQARAGQVVIYNDVPTNTGTTTITVPLTVNSIQQGIITPLEGGSYPEGPARLLSYNFSSQMAVPFAVSLAIPPNANGITEMTIITATPQTSSTVQATVTDTPMIASRLYLPFVLRRWPPLPYKPNLNPIIVKGCDGNYSVSWVEQPSRLAYTYTLQEAADNACIRAPRTICTTTQQSCDVSTSLAGTYYYCVRGANSWGYGEWSETESATVLAPMAPYLHSVDNADGDGTYTVVWNFADCASSYELQEATDAAFSVPETVYRGNASSWSAGARAGGTYYYRVRSNGATGASEWSNVARAKVLPSPIYQLEAEDYYRQYRTRPDGRVPDGGKGIHIGGDDATPDNWSGWVEYRFKVTTPINNALVSMRYADDVGGDRCTFLLDGNPIASLDTRDTGTWDSFVWTSPFSVSMGSVIGPGWHILRLEVRDSGSYGLTIDKFRIYEGGPS